MPPIPKQPRQVNGLYLEFLRDQPCSVCRRTIDIVPHHTISRGAFGSDYFSIPLCPEHHTYAHWKTIEDLSVLTMAGLPARIDGNPKIMALIIKNLIAYIEHLTLKQEGMTCRIP